MSLFSEIELSGLPLSEVSFSNFLSVFYKGTWSLSYSTDNAKHFIMSMMTEVCNGVFLAYISLQLWAQWVNEKTFCVFTEKTAKCRRDVKRNVSVWNGACLLSICYLLPAVGILWQFSLPSFHWASSYLEVSPQNVLHSANSGVTQNPNGTSPFVCQ